jgi:hypothetical protein
MNTSIRFSVSLALSLSAMVLVAGCGGGGGAGGSTQTDSTGKTISHDDLANMFIDKFNLEASDPHATLYHWEKKDTQQFDYIVVNVDKSQNKDWTEEYNAINIGAWTPGMNAHDYVAQNSDKVVDVKLISLYDAFNPSLFRAADGREFEETSATSKDLEKVMAYKQQFKMESVTEKLRSEFGLSAARSMQIARLATKLASAPRASMTDKDYDAFSKEIIGSSITEFKAAAQSAARGDSQTMNSLIDKAAQVNGIGPEHVNQILNALYNEQ